MTNTFEIRSPCHPEEGLEFDYENVGSGWSPLDRVSEIYCPATGCYNSWDRNGNPV
jgi:hypothetical protein